MPGRAFVDSNVLLYSISSDALKAARAEVIAAGGGVISVQVLNEFANVARRKYATPWPIVHQALGFVCTLFDVEPLTLDTHARGLQISERYGFGVFDSLLLAAALEAGCDTFWTEDLKHHQVIEGRLTIRNPFL